MFCTFLLRSLGKIFQSLIMYKTIKNEFLNFLKVMQLGQIGGYSFVLQEIVKIEKAPYYFLPVLGGSLVQEFSLNHKIIEFWLKLF